MNAQIVATPVIDQHTTPTRSQARAALSVLLTLTEAIRQLGSIPSGTLYAHVAGHMDLQTYNSLLARIKGSGLVEESQDGMLTWVGPEVKAEEGVK
jgi:hypothetical protein